MSIIPLVASCGFLAGSYGIGFAAMRRFDHELDAHENKFAITGLVASLALLAASPVPAVAASRVASAGMAASVALLG